MPSLHSARRRGRAAVAASLVLTVRARRVGRARFALAAAADVGPAQEWSGCTVGGPPVTSPPLLGNTGDGFLLDKDVFAPIELPGAKATTPIKVNARGQIVGVFSEVTDRWPLRPPFSGFLLDGGLFTRIEVPGAASTFPSASERKFDIGGRGSAP
jgi:hypothetical protein